MAEMTYSVIDVQFGSEGLNKLVDLMRPIAMEFARRALARSLADTATGEMEHFHKSEKESSDRIIATDGLSGVDAVVTRKTTGMRTVTFQSSFMSGVQPAWADGVDTADSYSVQLRCALWALALDVSANSVFIRLQAGTGYPTIGHYYAVLTDEEMDAFLQEVVDVIQSFPAPRPQPSQRPARPFRVFIGHGGDTKWKAVERALKAEGFEIVAYETAPRVGWGTLDAVRTMIASCTVGVIVMTATDEQKDGSIRARENVIHEMGVCHGLLGLTNTLVMVEKPITVPTNYEGRDQLRFSNGNIDERVDALIEALKALKTAHNVH